MQIIKEVARRPSMSERFGQAFSNVGRAAGEGIPAYMQAKENENLIQQTNKHFKENYGIDLSGITDPEERKIVISESLKGKSKEDLFGKKQDFLSSILGGKSISPSEGQGTVENRQEKSPSFDARSISDDDIARAMAIDPNIGRALRDSKNAAIDKERAEQKKFEADRAYHSGYTKDIEKQTNSLRDSIPKKENALNFARDALQTGNFNYFSPDKLADVTGIDLFRTAKGAQLVTAGKENLLSNLSRISAKAQNQWMEQRMSSMFPKIGQSEEANLTVQEMLESEVLLDRAYLNAFDRISKEDEDKYGFVKKDVSRRAHEEIKDVQKKIMDRTSYRIKEIEEQEAGLSRLKERVGKNVPRGTPLTLAMAKLYLQRYKNAETAMNAAKKNGYMIPPVEDFQSYRSDIEEFRGNL